MSITLFRPLPGNDNAPEPTRALAIAELRRRNAEYHELTGGVLFYADPQLQRIHNASRRAIENFLWFAGFELDGLKENARRAAEARSEFSVVT